MAPKLSDLKNLGGKTVTLNFILCFLIMSISVFSFGFDNVAYSSVQATDAFEKQFGQYNPKKHKHVLTAHQLALLNSLGDPSKAAGTIVGSLVGEHFGRKPCFIGMQFLAITGIIVSYTATHYSQILAGRMLVQGFVGWEDWLVPMFSAELAPAGIRGAMVVVYVFSHQFGAFICSFVTLGSNHIEGNKSWQIPIAVMFIFPSLALLFCWLIPESPRWFLRRNKRQAASKSLTYLMGQIEDFDVEAEISLLDASLEADSATKGGWLDLFRGTNLRRTQIAVLIGAFNQLTGQGFSTQYGTLFVKSLKIFDPFVFNVLNRLSMCLGPVVAFTLIDAAGRRPIYLVGGTLACAALMTQGGLGVGTPSRADKKGVMAMTVLFSFFYGGAFGAIGAVIVAEVPHLRLRDKTTTVVYLVHSVCDFAVTYSLPYLLNKPYADLQSKVGFIYGSVAFLAVIWAFFCLPETRNRSLEELEDMWNDRVPARKFKSWTALVGSIGHLITENERHLDHHRNHQDLKERGTAEQLSRVQSMEVEG